MKAPRFTKWFSALPALNQPQRLKVLDALRPAAGLHDLLALLERITCATRRCPHCQCEHWHRHGHANDLQRYRCRACRRSFNDLTGTPLARLRLRGKWLAYLDALRASRPVRAAADEVQVHRNTAFRWRHRFLDRVKHDLPERLNGIAEADEMFILESQKGSRKLDRPARKRGGSAKRRGISRELDCILVARDRSGQTLDAVTGHGAIHVQNVHAYHRRLRDWLAPFHGVASRYLPNYLGWRRMLDGGKVTSADQLFRLAVGLIHSQR